MKERRIMKESRIIWDGMRERRPCPRLADGTPDTSALSSIMERFGYIVLIDYTASRNVGDMLPDMNYFGETLPQGIKLIAEATYDEYVAQFKGTGMSDDVGSDPTRFKYFKAITD